MRLYHYLYILFCFTFLAISCTDKEQEKPNIIFILADDLGIGDVSCFNSKGKIKTTHLDRLATEGMIFTDAHTSSSVCTPTRYGILTGRYNWRSRLKSGVLQGFSEALIPQERTTVASLLKSSSYHTAFIGKWHLGWNWAKVNDTIIFNNNDWSTDYSKLIDYKKPITNGPNSLGFDYSYGHAGSLDMAPYVYVENDQVTAIPDTITQNKGMAFWRKGMTAPDFAHEEVTPHFFDKSIKYIESQSGQKNPFFLYLALPSPHTPILPTKAWRGKSGLNPYGDFVLMVDDYIGRLLQSLKDNGLDQNTIVIFTSDNGCSPMADFPDLATKGHNPSGIYRGHKADIFEGGHRVPFIVRWPERIKAGSICDQTICTTDFIATCADIGGMTLKENEGEDSYSLLPLFLDPQSEGYQREQTIHHAINGDFAIRKGNWKLIFSPHSSGWSQPKPGAKKDWENLPKWQLYNLGVDPGERNNLLDSNHALVEELRLEMNKILRNGRSTPGDVLSNDGIALEDWSQIQTFIKSNGEASMIK